MELEDLEPKSVWNLFINLFTKTYRESGHEELIRERIKSYISDLSPYKEGIIEVYEDSTGNLSVKKKTEKGNISGEPLLLQGHMDMVCVSDVEGFDFKKDPITPSLSEDNRWLKANGTSLGADNGIGVSIALALLTDPELKDIPFDILITVDEERGLTGAFNMDPERLHLKNKYMINIDSEEIGTIYIGAAGGGDIIFKKKFKFSSAENLMAEWSKSSSERSLSQGKDVLGVELSISGLLGGHSGVDIHLPRANAHKIIAQLINVLLSETVPEKDCQLRISSWNGGSKLNAIPTESFIRFFLCTDDTSIFKDALLQQRDALLERLRENEPKAEISIKFFDKSDPDFVKYAVLGEEESLDIVSMISSIPHGVIAWSKHIDDLVDISNNLAVIKTDPEAGSVEIMMMARSASEAGLDGIRKKISKIGIDNGWSVEMGRPFPPWTPKPDTPFLDFIGNSYRTIYGKDVEIKAIHAGLETGVIGAIIKGIEMVSVGATIENPHSVYERVEVNSVKVLYDVLKHILKHFYKDFGP